MKSLTNAFASPVALHQTSFTHSLSKTTTCTQPRVLKRARIGSRQSISFCTSAEEKSDANEEDDIPNVGDWREFRAALIAGSAEELQRKKEQAYRTGHWAHPLSLPETGCFLASHPAYYRRSAPYLTQAVVFLLSYDRLTGATGLVLNRPLRGTVTELEAGGMFGRSTNFKSTPIESLPVYAGGPDNVTSGVLVALHSDASLVDTSKQSTMQPLDDVYVSDVSDCLSYITSEKDCSDIRLFAGCIRWEKGELEREVNDGSWYCISASNLYALKHCIQLPKPLWVEIMQSQGHPFAQIASRVYDEDEES